MIDRIDLTIIFNYEKVVPFFFFCNFKIRSYIYIFVLKYYLKFKIKKKKKKKKKKKMINEIIDKNFL